MRKMLIAWLLLPLIGLGQKKNVFNVFRVSPKPDKVMEFEKALTSHARKFHTGNWSWRVYTVESGPDAGAYHVVEGPVSWTQFDGRGDLGKDHMTDWNKNVSPLTTGNGMMGYFEYRDDLSTVQAGDFSNKIDIIHVFPKVGYSEMVEELLKKLKKTFESDSETVAVFESSASGPTQFAIVFRYKQGLKEREEGFRAPFKDRYERANGTGSFNDYLTALRSCIDNAWSELLFYHPELSSK